MSSDASRPCVPRRRVRTVLLPLVVTVLVAAPALVGLVGAPAYACSCAQLDRLDQARAADVVLAGTVTDSEKTDEGSTSLIELTVEVDRLYKGGEPDGLVTVVTGGDGNSCGLGPLPTGGRYFFYLTETEVGLATGLCDGTGSSTAQLTRDVEGTLGPGRPVLRGVDAPEEPDGAARTLVAERAGEPAVLTAIAPGGVMAGVGLLGLLLLLPFSGRRD